MKEYIDREALIAEYDRVHIGEPAQARKLIEDAPGVDAVPVVRCKDCGYWVHVEDGYGDCTNRRFRIDGHPDPTMKFNGFCSCGERKDNV